MNLAIHRYMETIISRLIFLQRQKQKILQQTQFTLRRLVCYQSSHIHLIHLRCSVCSIFLNQSFFKRLSSLSWKVWTRMNWFKNLFQKKPRRISLILENCVRISMEKCEIKLSEKYTFWNALYQLLSFAFTWQHYSLMIRNIWRIFILSVQFGKKQFIFWRMF